MAERSIIRDPLEVESPPQVEPRPNYTSADLLREYVAGGQLGWASGEFLRALPHYIDDLSKDFSPQIYDAMLLDPAVSSSVNLLKLAILSDDADVTPAVDEKDPAYERATEIADSCRRMLEGLDDPFQSTLWQLLDALVYGHKVAEQVYEQGVGKESGRLVLKRLVVKPRRAIAFVVDPYLRVRGLLGRGAGGAGSILTTALVLPQQPPPNLLPREKFAILTWRPVDGDPRGTSVLRSAYNAWWIKTQQWPGYLKYLAQFGTPSLVGIVGEGVGNRVPSFDTDGNPVLDNTGNQVYVTREQAMLSALVAFQSSSVVVLPTGSEVKTLEPSGPAGSGQVYDRGRNMLNAEISLAILCQSLATNEARFGTRAQSQVHQDVLGLVIKQGKQALSQMIRRDILTLYVRLNWGEDALPLVPKVTLGTVEQRDTAQVWGAIAQLMSAGYLDQTQLGKLDAEAGLPVRDEDAIAEREAEQQKQALAIAQGQGAPPGGQDGQTTGPGQAADGSAAQRDPGVRPPADVRQLRPAG